jgi:hypothetical protein
MQARRVGGCIEQRRRAQPITHGDAQGSQRLAIMGQLGRDARERLRQGRGNQRSLSGFSLVQYFEETSRTEGAS